MPNPPRGGRPTIRTIAARAGVSYQTVSNVLNSPEKVLPATRAKVDAAITELNYRPSETARSLASAESRMIAIHTGDGMENEGSIIDPFVRELARIGNGLGYRLVLYYSRREFGAEIDSYRDLVAGSAVDGIVLSNTRVGDPRPTWLEAHSMPFAAFGRPWDEPQAGHSWVDVDGRLGSRIAVEHLRALGHRRIGYLSAQLDGSIQDERLAGWWEAASQGLPGLDPAALHAVATLDQVHKAIRQLLSEGATAVVCRDDVFAVEAMRAIDLAGLRPGTDVAVVGCDDSEVARHAHPRLSTLRQPITRIAQRIWDALLDQLTSARAPAVHEIIAPELVVRESSGPGV